MLLAGEVTATVWRRRLEITGQKYNGLPYYIRRP